ncbi:unnamed protein product [Calypogeia fissa]
MMRGRLIECWWKIGLLHLLTFPQNAMEDERLLWVRFPIKGIKPGQQIFQQNDTSNSYSLIKGRNKRNSLCSKSPVNGVCNSAKDVSIRERGTILRTQS